MAAPSLGLARRISAKRVYLLGLACSTVSMVLLLASTLVKTDAAGKSLEQVTKPLTSTDQATQAASAVAA